MNVDEAIHHNTSYVFLKAGHPMYSFCTKKLACFVRTDDLSGEAYGMRMGPCRMWDLVGIDLFARERERRTTKKW